MPRTFDPYDKKRMLHLDSFFQPVYEAMIEMPPLETRGNRPLQMSFEDQLKALVFFHL